MLTYMYNDDIFLLKLVSFITEVTCFDSDMSCYPDVYHPAPSIKTTQRLLKVGESWNKRRARFSIFIQNGMAFACFSLNLHLLSLTTHTELHLVIID